MGKKMRVVELFSGVGVSSCGMGAAGAEVVGACEIDLKFVHAYNSQPSLNHVATASDVDDYEIPECDLLSGGPVCKAFSPGANRFGTEGKDDVRNTFPHFFRALDRCDPRYVLVENSYGLARFGNYLSDIIKELQRRGYYMDCAEIDCYDYGVPQHRNRVVMLGSKDDPWYVTRPVDRTGPRTVGDCLGPAPEADNLPPHEAHDAEGDRLLGARPQKGEAPPAASVGPPGGHRRQQLQARRAVRGGFEGGQQPAHVQPAPSRAADGSERRLRCQCAVEDQDAGGPRQWISRPGREISCRYLDGRVSRS